MSKIHAALEIGTSRTVLAVGETQAGGRMKILSHAEIPSSGVRKSQIIDISQATQSIRSVLREIEAKQDSTGGNVEIHNALLVASGQHINVANAEGNAVVAGGRVGDAEIMEAARRSREMPIPKGRELLDIVDQDYQIDSLAGITSPKGMSGRMLRLNTLQIHASSDRIQDARTAAEGARLEISEPVFAATCTADAVLEEHERRNGVLVLDLGGGSTGYAAYCDGYLAAAGVVGVGGDHVTNDIAYAFQTTNAQAERLKTDEASAVIGQYTTDNARVRLTGSSALMESRAISRRALDTVVNARLKELFTVIRETLEEADLIHRLHAGVVIAGGGAGMRDLESLAELELGLGVRRGRPLQVDGLEDVSDPWAFATISGALLYSQRASGTDKSFLGDIIGRFFK
ncbi:MAG: cell division protein FtsA [Kiritimatiellae bacterium]|nr:cell division protein FtsA [Kiritimatiellia bacterium]